METSDSEAQKVFALLVIYGGRGLLEGELQLGRGHSKVTRDAVTAELVAQGLVTVRTRLISRRKVYMLTSKGSRLLQEAHKRVASLSQRTNDKGELRYGWKADSADRSHVRGLPDP